MAGSKFNAKEYELVHLRRTATHIKRLFLEFISRVISNTRRSLEQARSTSKHSTTTYYSEAIQLA